MNEEMKMLFELLEEYKKIMMENARMKAALEYLKADYMNDRSKGYGHDEVRIAIENIAGIKIPEEEKDE